MAVKKFFIAATIAGITIISISSITSHYTKPQKYIYTSYVVSEGQTLWQIAKEVMPGQDPRKTVYEIRKVNGITPMLRVNQTILVPVEVE